MTVYSTFCYSLSADKRLLDRSGVISGCLIMPDFIRRFGSVDPSTATGYVLNADRQSIVAALLRYPPSQHAGLISFHTFHSAGTFVDSFAQVLISDRIGRTGSISVSSVCAFPHLVRSPILKINLVYLHHRRRCPSVSKIGFGSDYKWKVHFWARSRR
jgi:hypothetical protein